MNKWCEHCRDHYPEDHYEANAHKVGRQYGPTGEGLANTQALAVAKAALEHIACSGDEHGDLAKAALEELADA